MPADVNAPRPYHAPQRVERAAATRRAVVAAAHELFTTQGFTATTVGQIAERAGVAVDTLYAVVGRKPVLLREVVETAISGEGGPVSAEQRGYVRAVRAAATAGEKIDLYAAAMVRIAAQAAPVLLALRDAAARDAGCAALLTEITERRAANMLLFAADLRATGELRPDLSDREVADIVWSMNSAEYVALLVHRRGWTPQRYGAFLADAWKRILLADPLSS
jgi:AcrR family transcriptional regulator